MNKKIKTNKKRMSLSNKIVIGIVSVLLILLLMILIPIVVFCFKINNDNVIPSTKVEPNMPVNILVMGMDIGDPNEAENQAIKRTDTIMLINYNPSNSLTQIVSIPRDMQVVENGKSYKINAAYQKGGDEKIKQVVENMLNVNINYITRLDYNAFRQFIDSIGGIDMPIERDMDYDDEAQNLHIKFKKGTVEHLDGKKAEEFFRWRKNNDGTGFANGDLDRINNQHIFLQKVMEKCTSPMLIFRLGGMLNSIADNMNTNMSAMDILTYGLKIYLSKKNGFIMSTVYGVPKMINGQSYLVFDKAKNQNLINSLTSSTSEEVDKSQVKIIVLNGTDINGLAAQVKTSLVGNGYTNVETGNTNKTDKSSIKVNINQVKQDIKAILPNISNIESKSSDDKYANYEVIITLGLDYRN